MSNGELIIHLNATFKRRLQILNQKSLWQWLWLSCVEWLLPIPEVRSLNPVIGEKLYWTFAVNNCFEKTKMKKKETGNGPFFKE